MILRLLTESKVHELALKSVVEAHLQISEAEYQEAVARARQALQPMMELLDEMPGDPIRNALRILEEFEGPPQ